MFIIGLIPGENPESCRVLPRKASVPGTKNKKQMSKADILTSIRRNKPSSTPLPEIPDFEAVGSPLENFIQNHQAISEIGDIPQDLAAWVKKKHPDNPVIVSVVKEIDGTMELNESQTPADFAGVDLTFLYGQLGVGENGAIWVDESNFPYRILPFITQHLVIILDAEKIVTNMHQAYNTIQIDQTGFGVFIAGPSKTADIEQSLVIGAHGPRSLTVFLR